MKPLSTVPWEDLQVGDNLISYLGKPGKIVKLEERDPLDEDRKYIHMEWKGVMTISVHRHYTLENVQYVGRDIPK